MEFKPSRIGQGLDRQGDYHEKESTDEDFIET